MVNQIKVPIALFLNYLVCFGKARYEKLSMCYLFRVIWDKNWFIKIIGEIKWLGHLSASLYPQVSQNLPYPLNTG
jgi:hypothetical protein